MRNDRSCKLINDQNLYKEMGGTNLRLAMDTHPLSMARSAPCATETTDRDFALRHLPRVRDRQVLINALQDAAGKLNWLEEGLAYADSFDESKNRYRGLLAGTHGTVYESNTARLVKPEVAAEQFQRDYEAQLANAPKPVNGSPKADQLPLSTPDGAECKISGPPVLKRFHGALKLNPMTASSDVSKLSEAVIQHLSSLLDAEVEITINIAAYMPEGAPDHVVRTVMENCRTLKFHPSPQFERGLIPKHRR